MWTKGVFNTIDVPDAVLTSAIGLNDHGDVVGVYIDGVDFNEHGFVLSKGVYTTLDAPGAVGVTVAQGINNAGEVVGYATDKDGNDFGFTLSKKGVYETIDVPGAVWTDVYSINADGDIVGAYGDASGVEHGYVGMPTH